MNVKALMLGLALAGFSTIGAHATVVFPASPDVFVPDFAAPPAVNIHSPVGGGLNILPLAPFGPDSAVPEPMTWAMMLVGLGGLGAVMRVARKPATTTAA